VQKASLKHLIKRLPFMHSLLPDDMSIIKVVQGFSLDLEKNISGYYSYRSSANIPVLGSGI